MNRISELKSIIKSLLDTPMADASLRMLEELMQEAVAKIQMKRLENRQLKWHDDNKRRIIR